MAPNEKRHALIVGAGLAGSLMACYLARAGWRVSVYERRPDPRAKGYGGGRSINLALSARGLAGLRGVGLDQAVLERDAIRMPGRMIHPAPQGMKALRTSTVEHRTSNIEAGGPASSRAVGASDVANRAGPASPGNRPSTASTYAEAMAPPTVFQPYSKDPNDAINSVSRGGLNLTLLEAADAQDSVSLHFEHACVDVDLDAPAAIFEPTGPSGAPLRSLVRIEADLVIGADGAFSAVRARMQKLDRFDYSQSYLEHGYKELHIPARSDEWPVVNDESQSATSSSGTHHSSLSTQQFLLDPHALHIWPRGGSMMIALPNRDGSFTCTLFWPFEGPHSFANLKTPGDVLAFFREQYPDAVPLMPTLTEDYFRNPTSSLVTVRCWPWQYGGKVVLIGDAAHAIVPFYGQGMNAAFEDCLVLADCFSTGSADEGLERFQAVRKPDGDAIADMAVENFVEMRDKVGDPAFLYKKKVEQTVHALFPDRVTPQYNLVSFSTVPYTEARRRGRELDAVLERIISRLPRDTAAVMTDEQWRAQVQALAQQELQGSGT